MIDEKAIFTGTQVNYYFICHRKLWLFSHNIGMEKESQEVAIGKFLQQKSYERKEKDILIDRIAIDFVEKGGKIIIHEVKKSKKMEKAHIYQLLYYIYYLRKRGIEAEGIINYPLTRKIKKVKLEDEREIEAILEEIKKIVAMEEPPPARRKPYCKRCAYYEFCWGD